MYIQSSGPAKRRGRVGAPGAPLAEVALSACQNGGLSRSHSMRIEKGEFEGNLDVAEAVTVTGSVSGDIRVLPEGRLQLDGSCGGRLIVEEGGSAVVCGMVRGDVHNKGLLDLRGKVCGSVMSAEGRLTQAPQAEIAGTVKT